jgi:electron transfer flavoprotein alpha subunit
MANDVFVWIEQSGGRVDSIAWELVGAARMVADALSVRVMACVLGAGVDDLAQEAIRRGADAVLLVNDVTLATYRLEPYAACLVHLAQEHRPGVFLVGASSRGRELAPYVAAKLGVGLAADCVEIGVENGSLVITRPALAGNVVVGVKYADRRPQMATLRRRVFPVPEPNAARSGEITTAGAVLSEKDIPTQVVEFIAQEGQVNLTDATIIVSGGRGVGGPDGFEPVRELADVLGAAMGASRAAVDAGWIPYVYQVGQTGKTVQPDLYIAAGISGAIQHLAGMKTAKIIVAINKDAEAPIFKVATYGVVGDLFKVVPALTEEFKKRLGK